MEVDGAWNRLAGTGGFCGAAGVGDSKQASSSSESDELLLSWMTGSAADGMKGDASTRKRCPERVTADAGSVRSPGSGAVGDDSEGATGRGGRTVE